MQGTPAAHRCALPYPHDLVTWIDDRYRLPDDAGSGEWKDA